MAVSSVAAATAWIFTPWDKIGPIDWTAVGAIGTLAAVAVALAVPLWQNWDRRREKELSETLEEWAVLQETYRVVGEVRKVLEDWTSTAKIASASYIQALIDDLVASKNSVKSPIGLQALNSVIGVARGLRAEAESSSAHPSQILQRVEGSCAMVDLSERMDACSDLQSVWSSDLIRRAVRSGAIKMLPK